MTPEAQTAAGLWLFRLVRGRGSRKGWFIYRTCLFWGRRSLSQFVKRRLSAVERE
ncbi:hypothetical protein RHGRI_021365 [Rhododendron griersonianum]|uniref:Uncharacterized protein n=1 Tax=Rhododendron griersonianum TaxID=479676 RepID=A0AAV6JN95_9ERIC|nr:hypothetical protein RHGRI_021365 [Rhododendron griersonianum]